MTAGSMEDGNRVIVTSSLLCMDSESSLQMHDLMVDGVIVLIAVGSALMFMDSMLHLESTLYMRSCSRLRGLRRTVEFSYMNSDLLLAIVVSSSTM